MEIKIGVQNVSREITVDVAEDLATLKKRVEGAMSKESPLELKDTKDRTVVISGKVIAYVEFGSEEVRRVGFGTL